MEIVRMMDCGDANRRADNGAFFGLNTISSAAGTGVTAKTAAYTLTAAESGKAFSNSGAGGSVTFTLPTPKPGMWFIFEKIENQTLVVAAGSGSTIENGANLTNNTAGDANKATLTVIATSTTTWKVQGYRGTWATV